MKAFIGALNKEKALVVTFFRHCSRGFIDSSRGDTAARARPRRVPSGATQIFCFYDEYFAGDNADNSPLWAASCQGPGQQILASHSHILIEKWTSKNI